MLKIDVWQPHHDTRTWHHVLIEQDVTPYQAMDFHESLLEHLDVFHAFNVMKPGDDVYGWCLAEHYQYFVIANRDMTDYLNALATELFKVPA